jgi:hypothetical protein
MAIGVERARHSGEPIQIIHRICGHLCGQVVLMVSESANSPCLEQVAESLGIKKMRLDNHLHHRCCALGGKQAFRACDSAAVEFSQRAGIGLARD